MSFRVARSQPPRSDLAFARVAPPGAAARSATCSKLWPTEPAALTNASGRTVVHDREEQRVTGHCRELTRAIDARVQDGLSLEFGAQANVATMAQGAGGMFAGAAAVSPGVYVYQITDTGLAATLAVAGTRFFKDADMD